MYLVLIWHFVGVKNSKCKTGENKTMNKIMKKSIMLCLLCTMFSVHAYSQYGGCSYSSGGYSAPKKSALTSVLEQYCVPASGNDCSKSSELAEYTSKGCSCNIGRYWNSSLRKCKECEYGSYKPSLGVEDCIQIECPVNTFLTTVSNCGVNEYRKVLQETK